jgi:hypothetical protein
MGYPSRKKTQVVSLSLVVSDLKMEIEGCSDSGENEQPFNPYAARNPYTKLHHSVKACSPDHKQVRRKSQEHFSLRSLGMTGFSIRPNIKISNHTPARDLAD